MKLIEMTGRDAPLVYTTGVSQVPGVCSHVAGADCWGEGFGQGSLKKRREKLEQVNTGHDDANDIQG